MYDMKNLTTLPKLGARASGTSREELAEATFVAAALRAGAAVTYGTHLVDTA